MMRYSSIKIGLVYNSSGTTFFINKHIKKKVPNDQFFIVCIQSALRIIMVVHFEQLIHRPMKCISMRYIIISKLQKVCTHMHIQGGPERMQ